MPKYTVERAEKIIGEYSAEQIKELTSSGELLGTNVIYAEDSTDWQHIVEFSVSQEIASELSKDRGRRLLDRCKAVLSIAGGGWGITKCIFLSILFALLTMWLSSLFSEISFWQRVWIDSAVVYYPFEDDGFGPIQFFVRLIWFPIDGPIRCRTVLYIWTFICASVGTLAVLIIKIKASSKI